jgi:hypothetical protein
MSAPSRGSPSSGICRVQGRVGRWPSPGSANGLNTSRLPADDRVTRVTYRKTSTELTGSRVVVRSYAVADAVHVWQAIAESRDSLLRWVPDIGRHGTLSEVRSALARLSESGAQNRSVCGVWLQSSGRFLGEVGLYDVDVDTGVAFAG